jgi:hypothetical protein
VHSVRLAVELVALVAFWLEEGGKMKYNITGTVWIIVAVYIPLLFCCDTGLFSDITDDITGNNPSIIIRHEGILIPAGTGKFDFGDFQADGEGHLFDKVEFSIDNRGKSDLKIVSISISGDDFDLDDGSTADSVAPSGSTKFYISFDPLLLGDKTGSVTVKSNDPRTGTYIFSVAGKGIDESPAGAPSKPDLASSDDTGASDNDNITKQLSELTFSGTAPIEIVRIILKSDLDGELGQALVSGGTWSMDVSLAEGIHAVTASGFEANDNPSPDSAPLVVVVDITIPDPPLQPDLSADDDTGTSNSDNITKKVSGLTFSGAAEPNSTITLLDGVTVKGTALATLGVWSIDTALAAGSHDIAVTATDPAGNISLSSPILGLLIDTSPPATPSVPDLIASDDTGASNSDNITKLSEGVTFTGTAEANGMVILYTPDIGPIGTTMVSADGQWECDANFGWDNTFPVHAVSYDIAGNNSAESLALSVTIDTYLNIGYIYLDQADDTGYYNYDMITNKTTGITLWGYAEPGASVAVSSSISGTVGTTNAAGDWIWYLECSLPEGSHGLTGYCTDLAGNTGTGSISTLIIDISPPSSPSQPDLAAADDSGSSNTDNITKNTSALTFSGTVGETVASGMLVALSSSVSGYLGSVGLSTSSWAIDVALSANHDHYVTAILYDVAGNPSTPSSATLVCVDTLPPIAPSQPDLAAEDDSGMFSDDNITNNTTGLTFSGTAESGIAISLSSSVSGGLGSTTAVGGNWSVEAMLSESVHGIVATATDMAGNFIASNPLFVTVDLTPPSANLLTPFQGANTGNNLKPTFKWRASTDMATCDLQVDDDPVFGSPEINQSALVGGSFTPGTNLSVSGTQPVGRRYYVRLRAVDLAGNQGAWSDVILRRYINVGRYDLDLNGDGYSDLAVADKSSVNGKSSAGRVYIYFGETTPDDTVDLTLAGEGVSNYEIFGSSIAGGDFNADGYCDLAIGASGYSSNAGKVYVFLGGPAMDGIADASMAPSGSYFGYSVASGGDVNGDGFSDLAVGAWAYNSAAGRTYVYYGGTTFDIIADVVITGASANRGLGKAVEIGGDLNGDGYSDLVTSEYLTRNTYVFFGGAAMDTGSDLTIPGPIDLFGDSLSASGDANGDGYADLLIGGPGTYGTDKGKVFLYLGGSPMDLTADLTLEGEFVSDSYGACARFCGDLNMDGFSDFAVTARPFSSYKGKAYIYLGGVNPDGTCDASVTGGIDSECVGAAVGGAACDFNADGFNDVAIGADGAIEGVVSIRILFGGSVPDSITDVQIIHLGYNYGYSIAR